jgi:hypothetical protein
VIQPVRRARPMNPAPMFCATIAAAAAPKPTLAM